MSFLERVGAALRAWKLADGYSPENPLFDAPPKVQGVVVNAKTSLQVTAVLACCRVLAETVASLSMITYKRSGRDKERAENHPVYELLHSKANQYMTAYQFFECMMYQALLYRGAYAVIRTDKSGAISELVPLKPGQTVPVYDSKGALWYQTIIDGKIYCLEYAEVLYIPGGPSLDGIVSSSIMDLAKTAIATAMATEDYGLEFFGNGAKPGGVLTTEQRLTDESYNRLKESWNNKAKNKVGGIKILEQGLKYQGIAMQNDQAQFLETRKFARSEIAAAYRVPPHLIADLEKATFSNIEHQGISFVVYSLRPWLTKWEQEINTKLFLPAERQKYFSEFLVDSLLRGDIKSRYEAYNIGRNGGWLSANDIRAKENMNAIDGGDIYLVPLNMTTAEQITEGGGEDGKQEGTPDNGGAAGGNQE